jgi:mandelate racemase
MTEPTITAVTARPVAVPLDPPLQSATGEVSDMPVLLLDAIDSDGATGHSYLLCYTRPALVAAHAFATALTEELIGGPTAPKSARRALPARLRLSGYDGIAGMVLGGLDMALWDLAARRANQPLVRLLGAQPSPIPAYASLRSADPARLRLEAKQAAERGFTTFKVKLGHGTPVADAAAIAAVHDGAGDDATVMADYNQTLSVPDAIERAHRLADLGVYWLEEPVAADDPHAQARVRAASPVPIQAGENWRGPRDAALHIAAASTDLAMLDAMWIGGVSGWLAAAALAEAAALPVSSHLFYEISAHLLAATDGHHWLEWMDITSPLLTEPPRPIDGTLTATDTPGTGITWDERAIATYSAHY